MRSSRVHRLTSILLFACFCALNQPAGQAVHYRKVQPFFVDPHTHAVKFVGQALRRSAQARKKFIRVNADLVGKPLPMS